MADVKRNTQRLQEQRREEERRIEEERRAKAYKNSPWFSDWRFELSENMTTQAMTYATTLPGTGDEINRTVKSGDSASFTSAGPDFSNTYAKISYIGPDTYEPIDFKGGSGAFPGIFGNDGVYFAMPYAGTFAPTIDSYNVTTQPFEVTDTSVSFEAIAGNSSTSLHAGSGLGNNGGTRPLRNLEVYLNVYKDDGTIDDFILLGEVPKNTTTKTKFTFQIPPQYFGKNVAINFYNSTNEGPYRAMSWMVGQNVSFHPTPLDDGLGSEFTAEVAYCILNYDALSPDNYYKQFSETTLAYFLWNDLQKLYSGDDDWGDVGNTTAGWPAPVSGATMGLWDEDYTQSPPLTNPSQMNDADLSRIVQLVRKN